MTLLLEEARSTRDAMRYGFAVGKVRVLMNRLLDEAAIERLLDAKDAVEQRRLLSDTYYGRFLEGAETADAIEAALDEALDGAYAFLSSAALPDEVVRFFRVRYDFENLKAAAKARALGASIDELLVGHGMVDVGQFRGDLDELPAPFGSLAPELTAVMDSDDPARMVDSVVDRALFAERIRLAKAAGSSLLVRLAALAADIANVKTLVRGSLSGMPAEEVTALLIDGGTVDRPRMEALAGLAAPDVAAAVRKAPEFRGVPVDDLASADSLDPIVDGLFVSAMRSGRFAAAGAEPVIAYVGARESEVRTLRVLLLGMAAGIDRSTLRQRVRAFTGGGRA